VRRPLVKILKFIWDVSKVLIIGSILFIGIPFIYETSNIQSRLDANIYDFYGVLILSYLVYRVYVLEMLIHRLKKPERVYFSMEDDEIDDDEWFKIDQ
jgi:hypothetical protein